MPEIFQGLPARLRWKLGAAIKARLARGWRPEDVLAILRAPVMAGMQRPFRLALWRLTMHLSGAGPRLSPLQRQWEKTRDELDKQRWQDTIEHDFQQVVAITTGEQRAAMAEQMNLDVLASAGDLRSAVIVAARKAWRCRPDLERGEAIVAWLVDRGADAVMCVSCGQRSGTVRVELPLQSVVCDCCWSDAELVA
jgi:hypothetical protein